MLNILNFNFKIRKILAFFDFFKKNILKKYNKPPNVTEKIK